MRYCSNCGTQNDADAKFCAGCGSKLEVFEDTVKAAAPDDTFTEDVIMDEVPPVAPTPDFAQQQFQQAPPQDFAQQQFQGGQYQQAQPYQNQYQQPYAQQNYNTAYKGSVQISPKCRTFGIISFILGIVSMAFCWLGIIPVSGIIIGFFMVAFAVVGLIFSGISRREGYFTLAKLGKIFSIIGLCLSAICWIIGIILTAGGYYMY